MVAESDMVEIQRAAPAGALVGTEARRRPAATVGLIATAALALSTVVAATAVSIGIARADTFAMGMNVDQASLAIALLIASLLTASLLTVMGGLTAVMVRDRS